MTEILGSNAKKRYHYSKIHFTERLICGFDLQSGAAGGTISGGKNLDCLLGELK